MRRARSHRAGTTSGRGRPCSACGGPVRRRSAGRRPRRPPCPRATWAVQAPALCWWPSAEPPDVPERGPDGLLEVAPRDEVSLVVDRDGELRQGPGGRAEDRLRALGHVELRLVAGAEDAAGLLLVQRHRAAGVRADLGEGEVVAVTEVLLAGRWREGLQLLGPQPDEHDRTVGRVVAARHGREDRGQRAGVLVTRADRSAVAA